MKKNLVSLAVAATVASAANAQMWVNPDKTGEVVLYPFYNAENGNSTTMHIVNTTADVKAVKVRFLEYKNSDEVLDFNLYLSPFDHFSWVVIADPNGDGAAMLTRDNSCTVPELGGPNPPYSGSQTEEADGSVTRVQPFVNFQYDDDLDDSIERTLMGHVEVIEMGIVNDFGDGDDDPTPEAWATHGATGVPANCAAIDALWAAGWGGAAGSNFNIDAPEGGLYGLSYHLNVDDAAAFAIETTQIAGFSDAAMHTEPGFTAPSLNSSDTTTALVYTGAGYEVGDYGDSAPAVSALLMTQAIHNDVVIDANIGAQTDWVITFPTKRFHVDVDLTADPIPPFAELFNGDTGGANPREDLACEDVTVVATNREERRQQVGNGFSPTPDRARDEICLETNLIAFGAGGTASALNGEIGLINLAAPYTTGWSSILFQEDTQVLVGEDANGDDFGLVGLPAVGFAAYKYTSGAVVEGAAYNYGHTNVHVTETALSVVAADG
jgi:hypothetical protein